MIDDEDFNHGLPEFILGKTKLLSKRRGALHEERRSELTNADQYLLSHLRERYEGRSFVRGNLDAGRLNRLVNREIILLADNLDPRSPNRLLRLVANEQDWTAVECYFAIWAYDCLDIDRSSTKSSLYQDLSRLLRRSPNAIRRKVENVSHFDTRPRGEKAIGASPNAQRLLGDIFSWYWPRRAAARQYYDDMARRLEFGIAAFPLGQPLTEIDESEEMLIEEGQSVLSNNIVRQRSRALLLYARNHFRKRNADGKLRCAGCDFSTPQAVATNREIVQIHHTRPLYNLGPKGRRVPLRDAVQHLVPLCPTCHQIAHAYRPPIDVERIMGIRKSD